MMIVTIILCINLTQILSHTDFTDLEGFYIYYLIRSV